MSESVSAIEGAPVGEQPTPRARIAFARARDWLLCRPEFGALRTHGEPLSIPRAAALGFARDAVHAATKALSPIYPTPFGSDAALAFSLLRDAAYWALVAQPEDIAGSDLAALSLEPQAAEVVRSATGREGALDTLLSETLVGAPAARFSRAPSLLQAEAPPVLDVVRSLITRADGYELARQRARRKRALRVTLAALLAIALLVGIVSAVRAIIRRGDLAFGKPWTTSSTLYKCAPREGLCGGTRTKVFFHTADEQSPWVSIDLGRTATFSRVEVRNRSDCCMERAVPLVVELSDDGKSFRQVSRREEPFVEWTAKLGEQHARYVRLRADKKTILHLEKIEVR